MSAVDIAVRIIKSKISKGELKPGDKLPAEDTLSRELNISRGSVREAVRILSALGILETRHGAGTYVTDLSPYNIMQGLAKTIELVPLKSFLEIYELRRVLEAHAASLACANILENDMNKLNYLHEEMLRSTDSEKVSNLDQEFHECIFEATKSDALKAMLKVLRAKSRSYVILREKDAHTILRQSNEGHARILHAIKSKDPILAAAAMSAHIADTERRLEKYEI